VLDSSPYKWLHEMLECFNHGDLHQYDALCSKHAAVLNAQPALVENERRLREKVGCAESGARLSSCSLQSNLDLSAASCLLLYIWCKPCHASVLASFKQSMPYAF